MSESRTVIYEFPCNEKIRTCLRLEKTMQRMHEFITQDSETAALSAFVTLFELIDLTTRPDLRKDLIQELQRNRATLAATTPPECFTPDMISDYLTRIDTALKALITPNPAIKSPQSLRDNDWLSTIRTRSKMPGGCCCFDLPSLHFWFGKPFEERHAQFVHWLAGTEAIKNAVDLILDILRSTISHRACSAKEGSVNLPVPTPLGWSLIQIGMPANSIHIPEVSVNKFMLWIHFLDASAQMRTPPSRSDIDFDLGLCGI